VVGESLPAHAARATAGGTGAHVTEPGEARTGTAGDERVGLARSSVAVATGTALSRITGLLRVGALAFALGGSRLADAYNLANTTPNIVYELLIGGIIAATIVPLFVRHVEDGNTRSTSAVFTVTLTVLTGFTVFAMVCTPLIARLFTIDSSGVTGEAQRYIITVLTLCFLPQMVFYGLTALATALLNAHRRFLAAAYAPVLNNIVVIVMLLVFAARTSSDRASWADGVRLRDELGLLLLLGLGTTAGIVVMALSLVPALRRAGVQLRPVFAWRDEGVRTLVRLSGWIVGYVAMNQIAQLFVLVLAQTGTEGNVTAYVYAFTFYVLPHSLLAVTIMTIMTPELARRAAADDIPGLRRDFKLGLRYLVVLTVPASVLLLVLAQPAVGILTIGKFDVQNAQVTADTLQLFALSLVPFSLYLYAMRAFYARQDTRTPFMINAVENVINIVLALALFPALGVQGLALAWSVAYTAAAIIAMVVLRNRVGTVVDVGVRGAISRSVIAAAALAIVAIPLAGAIGSSPAGRALLAALVATAVGAVAYVAMLAVLRSEELGTMVNLIRRRLHPADVSP
jgi:putative peptidoglycan lipid II flippase